jgi:hypothetical protein
MQFGHVEFEFDDGVGVITRNRRQAANALRHPRDPLRLGGSA